MVVEEDAVGEETSLGISQRVSRRSRAPLHSPQRRCACPAALLPYPANHTRRRPVALRPTLSSGLPLTGFFCLPPLVQVIRTG